MSLSLLSWLILPCGKMRAGLTEECKHSFIPTAYEDAYSFATMKLLFLIYVQPTYPTVQSNTIYVSIMFGDSISLPYNKLTLHGCTTSHSAQTISAVLATRAHRTPVSELSNLSRNGMRNTDGTMVVTFTHFSRRN
ncbi:hypothetical protein BDQ17DRAFT_171420 [Cyathus striatus]|nr:hypothetical protein BDQ17DRAFT_171420 [Cyathus striatus]